MRQPKGPRLMDYQYLSSVVGGASGDGYCRARAAAREAVRDWAIGALREVADGSRPIRAVTHPLGFTCLPVERAGRAGVCVHLWSPRVPSAAPSTSAIHAHGWQLTSYVLFGSLVNSRMVVADAAGPRPRAQLPGGGGLPGGLDAPYDDGARGLYRVLEVRSQGDVDELVPTPRHVRCLPGQVHAVSAGDVYSVAAGVFHATEVRPDAEAATVALGQTVPGLPDRTLGPPNSDLHRVRRRRCDRDQSVQIARVILDRLLAATACPA